MTLGSNSKVYFPHLDVVRFYAAFMIVIVHAYECWVGWYGEIGFLSGGSFKELTQGGVYVDRIVRNFGIGVDVFFLISGFLITYLLLQERNTVGKIHVGKFILRRTLRIWPLYFFLIALAPLLVYWVDAPHPNYLANSLFLGNFETIQTETWTYPFAHFWSICIEEHYYLVWPFIIAFVPIKRLMPVLIFLLFASISYRLLVAYYMEHPWYHLYLHTISRMDVLVIGGIGALLYFRKPFSLGLPRYVSVIVLGLLLTYLSLDSGTLWNNIWMAGFKKYIYLIPIAFLLVNFNFNTRFKHLLRPKSFVHYLGKVSYGIYMYHNVLLLIVMKEIMWEYQINNMYVFFGIVFALCIIIPIISYELLEKPFLKISKRFRIVKSDR